MYMSDCRIVKRVVVDDASLKRLIRGEVFTTSNCMRQCKLFSDQGYTSQYSILTE